MGGGIAGKGRERGEVEGVEQPRGGGPRELPRRRRHGHVEAHRHPRREVAHPVVARLVAQRSADGVGARLEIVGQPERGADDEVLLEHRERLLGALLLEEDGRRPGHPVERDARGRLQREDGGNQERLERLVGVDVESRASRLELRLERHAIGGPGVAGIRLGPLGQVERDAHRLGHRPGRSRDEQCREGQNRRSCRHHNAVSRYAADWARKSAVKASMASYSSCSSAGGARKTTRKYPSRGSMPNPDP